jgi:hypothetical protein
MKKTKSLLALFIVISLLFSLLVVKAEISMAFLMLFFFLLLYSASVLLVNIKGRQIYGLNVSMLIFLTILLFYIIKIIISDIQGTGDYLADKYPFLLSFHLFLAFVMGIILACLKKKNN